MKDRSFLHAFWKPRKGQGLVEFALIIPILLTIIFGIFEAARLVWVYTAVASASREAARFGSSVGDNGSGTPIYLDCDSIRGRALELGGVASITEDDVTIEYDDGVGNVKGACGSVSAGSIVLGDRVIVEVVGYFRPAAAMPLFTFPTYEISSETRRTIVKEADLSSAGSGGSQATNTPPPSETPTPSNTPTITLTPSSTPTPGPTNTPTLTLTPSNILAPHYLGVDWTVDGGNCKWLLIGFGPDSSWSSDPGYGPNYYQISWTGNLSGSETIPSEYPGNVTWQTWQTLNDGYVVTYSFAALFDPPLESLPSEVTLQCVNGTVIQP